MERRGEVRLKLANVIFLYTPTTDKTPGQVLRGVVVTILNTVGCSPDEEA